MRKLIIPILLLLPMLMSAQIAVSDISHIDAHFRQLKQQALLTEPQVLTGTFQYDAPSSIIWKYDKGIDAKLPEQMLRFIASAVSGRYLRSNDDFSVTSEGNIITLTPLKRQLRKMFSSIQLYIRNDSVAEKVVLNEATGDITTIIFTYINTY